MTGAANIATEVAQAEVDAVVAAGAAEVAVLAADAVVIAAEQQVAQVTAAAAIEIQQAEIAIAENEEDVSWLKQKTQTLEAQHIQTMETVSSLQAQVSELTSSIQSLASLSLSQPPQALAPEIVGTPPENADAPQEAAPENPSPPRAKKRLRRL